MGAQYCIISRMGIRHLCRSHLLRRRRRRVSPPQRFVERTTRPTRPAAARANVSAEIDKRPAFSLPVSVLGNIVDE